MAVKYLKMIIVCLNYLSFFSVSFISGKKIISGKMLQSLSGKLHIFAFTWATGGVLG